MLILVFCISLFSYYWYNLENNTASVFDISYVTVFERPDSKTDFAPISKVFTISRTKVPEDINPKSSSNDIDVTVEVFSTTTLKTALI